MVEKVEGLGCDCLSFTWWTESTRFVETTWIYEEPLISNFLQSAIVFFIIAYSYMTPTARSDGFIIAQYEFATV